MKYNNRFLPVSIRSCFPSRRRGILFLFLLQFPLIGLTQVNLQVAASLRKSRIPDRIEYDVMGNNTDRPVILIPSAGASVKLKNHFSIGFNLSRQKHERVTFELNGISICDEITSADFNQTRLHLRSIWQPFNHWRLQIGPTWSYFDSFKLKMPCDPQPRKATAQFRSQLGLAAGVGYQFKRFILQLNYDQGLAFQS
ncbi:MAG: hypothetical protein WBA17_00070 [Saprospiraceae bacterium]